jgi:hypothetical protein
VAPPSQEANADDVSPPRTSQHLFSLKHSQDLSEKCQQCRWPDSVLPGPNDAGDTPDDINDLHERQITPVEHDKVNRPSIAVTISTIGGCALSTRGIGPVTQPAYRAGQEWLDSQLSGLNPPCQTDMPRWSTKTTIQCIPTVVAIDDTAMAAKVDDAVKSGGKASAGRLVSMDHVWEKSWMREFLETIIGKTMDCATMNEVFFLGNDPANRMGEVWAAMPGLPYWDMIGMTENVNNEMKNRVSHHIQH